MASSDILADLAAMRATNLTAALSQFAILTQKKDASLDAFFLITMGVIIYFMQCGFAFLEAGAVRSKNTTNILIKNILDSFIGGICYFILGYALAFGENGNPFCGGSWFALAYIPSSHLHLWFFHYVFAATAATIVSGAVAERCDFPAYLIYSVVITGFIYPIVTHWTWDSTGWLNVGVTMTSGNVTLSSSFQDFAGSGVVHVLGGTCALIAALILGPRADYMDQETKQLNLLPGHSVPLVSLGGFILFFGFFAFNGGSQASISKAGDGEVVAAAVINTILSASVAAFIVMIFNRVMGKYWSLLETINGALAGMVAICAGCNVVYPWGACLVGLFAAVSYMLWSKLMTTLKIDDPLDAVAVHLGGGIWGVISVAFLNRSRGILFKWDQQSGLDLGWQLAGLLAIVGWSVVMAAIVFGCCRLIGILRVPVEYEIKGLDIPKHGEPAYPIISYGHGWESEGVLAEIGGHLQQVPEIASTCFPRNKHGGDHHKNAYIYNNASLSMSGDKLNTKM